MGEWFVQKWRRESSRRRFVLSHLFIRTLTTLHTNGAGREAFARERSGRGAARHGGSTGVLPRRVLTSLGMERKNLSFG